MRHFDRLEGVLFPARDRPMSRLMAGLSESESGPPADNFVTNEDSFGRVVGAVERLVPAGGVYLGVGPDQNLSYIAACQPSLALILDHRRRNALVHLIHKAILMLEPTRAGYLARLLARAPRRAIAGPGAADLVAAFDGAPLDRDRLADSIARVASTLAAPGLIAEADRPELARVQSRLAGPGLAGRFLALPMYPTLGRLLLAADRDGLPAHFLADDVRYARLRDLQLADRAWPLVADLAGAVALPALARWLRDHALSVSLVYLSDVEFFLLRAGRLPALAANLARLPLRDDARLIRASTREIAHPDRAPGDSSTTILRPLAPYLDAVAAGRMRTIDDLFI